MDPAQLYHLLHNPLFKEPKMSLELEALKELIETKHVKVDVEVRVIEKIEVLCSKEDSQSIRELLDKENFDIQVDRRSIASFIREKYLIKATRIVGEEV